MKVSDDRGSVSAFVLGLVMTFVACAGLAVDGGRIVTAKVRVSDIAENAARVGAQAITDIRLGTPSVDRERATRIAAKFLGESGVDGSVSANRFEVCVVVGETVRMAVLNLVGVSARHVSSRRCARPIVG